MKNKYLYFFSCCFLVKGSSQSIICDVQRRDWQVIPNTLFEILENLDTERNIETLRCNFSGEDLEVFDSYINFLLENEYIFFDSTLHNKFPEIEKAFDIPKTITNCIIEIDKTIRWNIFQSTIEELERFRCESIELRFIDIDEKFYIEKALDLFVESGIRSIRLIVNNHPQFDELFWKFLGEHHKRIREVFIVGLKEKILNPYFMIIPLDGSKIDCRLCGEISELHFSSDLQCFMEAHFYNSCLYKKISITTNGDIKNCPSTFQKFGNIKKNSLEDALKHHNFKKYWNLTKDKIEVCKDCEFRYICTDCRAYTERTHIDGEGVDTSKPLKCGYNPYTGDWEDWSTNPLKQKAIYFYGMQDLVKKNES